MKKLFAMGIIALSLFFTACSSQSPNEISKGTIEDAVEDVLKQNMLDKSYTKIMTGYYECNNPSTRTTLAKLAAAGVIDYKVERFAWWNKHLAAGRSWGGYYGYTNYSYEEHFMVNVALTEEGKKIMVDSIPMPEKKVDEDMKQPDVDRTKLPEYNYKVEKWPEIPNPELQEEKPVAKNETVEEVIEDVYEDRSNVSNIFDDIEEEKPMDESEREAWLCLDIEMQAKYEAALKKVSKKEQVLKSSSLEVDKARYIQTYVDQQTGLSMAKAEVIVTMVDVTPAGRIFDDKLDGTKLCANVLFVYYQDKGWTLLNDDFSFKPTSDLGIASLKQGVSAKGQDISASSAKREESRANNTPYEDHSEEFEGFDDGEIWDGEY